MLPLLYRISDGQLTDSNFHEKRTDFLNSVDISARAGIDIFQIREKSLSVNLLSQLTKDAVKITRNSDLKIFVNDRADVALASGADGVHLTSNSISPNAVRSFAGEKLKIGVSTHSEEELQKAFDQKADLVVFSPIFTVENKGAAVGIDELIRLREKFRGLRILALGGINSENWRSVIKSCAGIAGIRIFADANLPNVVKEIKKYAE